MMPTTFPRADCTSVSNARQSDEFLLAGLAVMPPLEASLHRSRKALLAMDLEGIERETREQIGLIGKLQAVRERSLATLLTGGREEGEARQLNVPAYAGDLAAELRRSGNRIREAALLQAALLARAQHKLHVLGNVMAGLSVTYSPPFERNRA